MQVKQLENLSGRNGVNVPFALTSTDSRVELHLGYGEDGEAVNGRRRC